MQQKTKLTLSLTFTTNPNARGAGSKLQVGGAQMPARSAGKNFFLCPPPHFSVVPPSLGGGGTAHTRVGTKMGSHSPLFVRKEMACS